MALECKGFLCRDPHRPCGYRMQHNSSNGLLTPITAVPDMVHVPLSAGRALSSFGSAS